MDLELPAEKPERGNRDAMEKIHRARRRAAKGMLYGALLFAGGLIAALACFAIESIHVFRDLSNSNTNDPAILAGRMIPVLDDTQKYVGAAVPGFVILVASFIFRLSHPVPKNANTTEPSTGSRDSA